MRHAREAVGTVAGAPGSSARRRLLVITLAISLFLAGGAGIMAIVHQPVAQAEDDGGESDRRPSPYPYSNPGGGHADNPAGGVPDDPGRSGGGGPPVVDDPGGICCDGPGGGWV